MAHECPPVSQSPLQHNPVQTCYGGCDCGHGTVIASWTCSQGCVTAFFPSDLTHSGHKVKPSLLSQQSQTLCCANGHPLTSTSSLLTENGNPIGLAGGLSHQRSRLFPYTIRRCAFHRQLDARNVNAHNYWPCPDCVLINAHGEGLVTLEFALNFHENNADRARDFKTLTTHKNKGNKNVASAFPGGPLRDHLEFCATLDSEAERAAYAQFFSECRSLLLLMAEFAGRLIVKAPTLDNEEEEPAWFYNTDMCARQALVESISALRESGVPGFGKVEFKDFDPKTFHKASYLVEDPDMEWETVDPRLELAERNWRRFFRSAPIRKLERPLLRYHDVEDEHLYE